MRPSSKVASSRPTVKRTHGVPGSASGQRCEYSPRDLSSVVSGTGTPAAIRNAQQPRRLRRRDDDRAVRRPRRAARIAADVRQLEHRPAADRHLGQLAVGEERDPLPVRREERLPRAFGASQAAQRGIAQLAQVESPRPAFDRLEDEQRPGGRDRERRGELARERDGARAARGSGERAVAVSRDVDQQETRARSARPSRAPRPSPMEAIGSVAARARPARRVRSASCSRSRSSIRASPMCCRRVRGSRRRQRRNKPRDGAREMRPAARSSPARPAGRRRPLPTRSVRRTPAGGQHLVEHAAERPDVRARVDVLARHLLRAHVARGADARAPTSVIGSTDSSASGCTAAVFASPKSTSFTWRARGQHHVRRLEVAVDHALGVRFLETRDDLHRDFERFFEGQRSAGQTVRQRFTLDALEDQVGRAVQALEAVDRRDVRDG